MKGEVMIRIEGLMLERLLQRALSEGASFKTIRPVDKRTLIVEAMQPDGDILLNLCRRYSISAKVLTRQGKPLIRDHLRKRLTLPLGFAVCIALCWLFLSRIWFIDVDFTGPQSSLGERSAFLSTLDKMDLRPGITDDIDTALLSGQLEAAQTGYSYVSAKVQGIRLLIEAAPEVPVPEVYDLSYARDLYSNADGIVVSVDVHSGVACVQPGDIVKRGQLLIRGEEQVTKEETRSIGALGEVILRTWYQGTSQGNLTEIRSIPTGRTASSARLELMGFVLPITTGETFDQYRTEIRHLPIGGLYLPLEIVFENRIETRDTVVETNLEDLSDRLCTLAFADAAVQLSLNGPDKYEIARSWINFESPGADMLTACAVYEIYTDAATTMGALLQGG